MSDSSCTTERQREAQIQDDIRKELGNPVKYPGLVLWRNNVGQMIDQDQRRVVFGVGGKGAADLLGIYRSRFIAVEVKTPEGRQTPEQKTFQALVEHLGGAYCLARSVSDAVAFIERLRREHDAQNQRRSA